MAACASTTSIPAGTRAVTLSSGNQTEEPGLVLGVMHSSAERGKQRSCGKQAFTLVELLVVLAVIAILAALLLPAIIGGKERAKRAACKNAIRQFSIAVHAYA